MIDKKKISKKLGLTYSKLRSNKNRNKKVEEKKLAVKQFETAYEILTMIEKVKEIATRLKLHPDLLVDIFFKVGLMVMNQTVINLKSELKIKLIEIFPKEFKHLTDNDFAELVTIFNSLKPKE